MGNLGIGGTFTVNTVEDGESAPYYFQEWFAWSNDSTTASVSRAPAIAGSWATSIPAQGAYAYLWRKSIRYVWNENTRQYSAEAAQYFRMSGTDGTSIHTRGQVANASSRDNGTATIITDSGTQTITLSDGDAVTQLDNGHLYQWVTEGGGKWLDLGQFKGESGVTYYTHIAWATAVTLSNTQLPIPSGQTNRPNALEANISGFSITPLSGVSYAWMGYLIDTNSSDSQTKQNYTWQRNKGEKGDKGDDAQYIYLKGTARDANSSITTNIPPIVNVNGGTNLAINRRGLNLVTINRQTLAMVESINYDTYGDASGVSGATGITDLIDKLNALDNSVFVCLVSYDAIGWSDNLIAALQGYGMGDLPYTATGRYPFLFIGYKNLGRGNGLTRMRNVGSYTDVVELSVYIANGALTVKDGEKGENAFVVDLENEMTNVALDENGDLIADFDMYFKVRAYYGTTNVLSDSACSVSASCSDQNVNINDTNAKTTGILVQVAQNVALANSTNITVTVTHTTYGTRTVIFTLAGVRGGENAVLQELLPSLDAISFARLANGSLSPDYRDLSLSIKKTQGGTTSTQTTDTSGLTIRWALNSMPSTSSDGTSWGGGNATGITWNNGVMRIASNVSAANIYIAAFNSDGTLVDRETIPVIKDGKNGVSYCFDFTKAAARVDENNIVTAELAGYAYKYVGSVRSALTSTTIRYGYILTDSDTYVTATTNSSGFFDAGTWFNGDDITDYGKNSPSIFAAIVIDGTVVHAEMITISIKGNRGKVGRFFYFGGTFNPQDNDPTHVFVVNDAQAPYFEHTENGQKRYHVFNYDTNDSYTMAQMWAISSNWNNAPWEVMTNDFKYIITEAIFGNYAHFGGAIINKDWLISQYGTINGIPSQDYSAFDEEHPSDSTGTNFIPNYAIDLYKGVSIQNSTLTMFMDTSGYFTYHAPRTYKVAGWLYEVKPENPSSYLYINQAQWRPESDHPTAGVGITLTNDVSFIGKTVVLFDASLPPFATFTGTEVYLDERVVNGGDAVFYGLGRYSITSPQSSFISHKIAFMGGHIEFLGVPATRSDGTRYCGWLVTTESCSFLSGTTENGSYVFKGL